MERAVKAESGQLIEPTMNLQFIERKGRMILQQRLRIVDHDEHDVRYEWRDVPVCRGDHEN